MRVVAYGTGWWRGFIGITGLAVAGRHGGGVHSDGVVASGQVGEVVGAIGGGGGVKRAATGQGQDHLDIGQTFLARILHAISVLVIPDVVADGAVGGEAEVDVVVAFSGCECHWLGIAVGRRVTSRHVGIGFVDENDVVTRGQIVETVDAAATGGCGVDHRLASIDHAIAIRVLV